MIGAKTQRSLPGSERRRKKSDGNQAPFDPPLASFPLFLSLSFRFRTEVSLGGEMDLSIELSGSDCLARTVHNGSGKKKVGGGSSMVGKKSTTRKHTDL